MKETHPEARRLLKRAREKDRLAHSYLLAGPEGAGKRTLAIEFAASLVCEKKSFPPCGLCSSCRRAPEGTHPDVHIVRAEGRNIRIDEVRALSSALHYHSYEGGFRAGVVIEVQRMTEEAQNAFLKTLEEPPDDTLLVLTATNLSRLLPTIISRCQVMRLGPLPTSLIAQMVEEKLGLSREEASLVSALSQGNARRALEADPSFVIEFRKKMIQKLLKLDPRDQVAILDFAEDMSKADRPVEELMDLLAGFYRDVLHQKLGTGQMWNTDIAELVSVEAKNSALRDIMEQNRMIHAARTRAVEYNANVRLNWEILAMGLRGVEGAAY